MGQIFGSYCVRMSSKFVFGLYAMYIPLHTYCQRAGLSVPVWFCPAACYHLSYAAVGVSCIRPFDVAISESHIMAALLTDLPGALGHV